MKIMSMKMMCLMAGIGVLGYMYLKMNPNTMNDMKATIKDASRKVYNMMEDE